MNKSSIKLTVIFTLTIFLTIAATTLITGGLYFCLRHLGILRSSNPHMILLDFSIVSIASGIVLSIFATRRILSPIIKISQAAREITRGNFNVRVEEHCLSAEVSTMAHNFNIMIQELAGMETFRSDFINNVSHEFKTPLSAIEGYATLLQNRNLKEEKRNFYISKILYNTKRLSTLSGNILELSRLENQEINSKCEVFSLDEQLRQIILLFQNEWSEKNLDCDIDLSSVDYYGNSELLADVWQNLIGNAVKFVPQNGAIRVLLYTEDDSVIVQVIDNGPGISADAQKRIFEKFYQGDTSHSAQGNGLGLTLAKRIVDLHEGRITVESEEGKGTAFTVTLPQRAHRIK